MNYRILIVLIATLFIIGSASAVTYTNKSLPAVSFTWTNSTTNNGGSWYPYWATTIYGNNAGPSGNNNDWLSTLGATGTSNQRFNIDFGPGNETIVRRVYYENSHNSGTLTDRGAKDFVMYGSNTAESNKNVTYANLVGWSTLTTSTNQFELHNTVDGSDPHNFTVENSFAYRNYSFAISNNWGGDYMGLRRLVFQTEDGYIGLPIATFTASNVTIAITNTTTGISGYVPTTVQFSNTTPLATNITSFVWTATPLSTGVPFAFNTTSAYPRYTFTGIDNYFIRLNVSGTAGANTSTQTFWVNTSTKPQIVADFTANTTAQTLPPGEIAFTDLSLNSPDAWLWDFGDGSTSALQNPKHTYTTLGLKTVSLKAYSTTNATDTDTETKTDYINITYSPFYVHADFLGAPTSGSSGLLVSFTDSTIVGNTTATRICNWSFGDSLSTTPYSSLCGNVQHVYVYSGVYDVNLSVTILGNTSYELKTQYITISSNQQTTWYTPTQVELTTVNEFGNGIPGVLVSGTPLNFTAPANWAEILIGIQPTVNMSGTTIYGFTGSDGSWSAPVLQSYRYRWTFVNGTAGINQEATFYPTDPTYRIWITTGTQQNYTYSQVASTNLTFTQPDAGNVTLGMNYYDSSGLTHMVNFTVFDYQNNTVYYTQSVTGGALGAMVTSTYTLPNIRGNEYVWKYEAYRTDGSELAQGNSVMCKGLSGVLVDLGLPVDWYRWISVCVLFLIGSMSSQRTKQYWAILIPVFAAIFFWFGWFTGQSTLIGIVTLCAVLGVIVYMKSSLREKFGIGGPGSFIINLVAYLIILQACIGFINGLGVWDASTNVAIDSQYKNVEITQDIPNLTNAGGVLGDVTAISTILFDLAFTMLRVLLSILGAIAFIYPTIAQMFPLIAASPQATAFLLLLQVGIWMTYAFFLYRLYKGDVGGVEL